jgi:uncharacterized protein YciI
MIARLGGLRCLACATSNPLARSFHASVRADKLFLLQYEYVADILEARKPHRTAHLRHAQAAHNRGHLLAGGALTEPIDAGLLLFDSEDADLIEQFVTDDPYVHAGLVTGHRIR